MKYEGRAVFLLCTALMDYAQSPVTFQVNMRVKTAEGLFLPGIDVVTARGSFQSPSQWGNGFTLTNNPGNPDIYQGTYEVPGTNGESFAYQFVYNTEGSDQWESISEREFNLQSGGQTLPVVYYDDDAVITIPIKAAVFFQVDMNVQITAANFNKTTEEVWARGNKIGWGNPPACLQLFEDATRPGIYTNTFTTDSQLTGDSFEYKHTIWRPDPLFQTVFEDGANRVIVFDGTEPTNAVGYHLKIVGPAFFNGISPDDVLAADTTVTFRLDMNGAQTFPGGTPFDANTQGVWFNGSFVPWWSWGSSPTGYRMFDDGTHGDAIAGDKIYSWQRLFPKASSTRLEYKYGVESADNEAAFGVSHVRFIRAAGSYVMPVDTFGVMLQESVVGPLATSSASGDSITLTWDGRPGVHLQSATTLTNPVWEDVANTDGQSSKVLQVGGGHQFFRLVKP